MPTNKPIHKPRPEYEHGYDKGRRDGILEGYEFLFVIMLMVLKDKHDAPTEEIDTFQDEILSYVEMVRQHKVSFSLLKHTLHEEYGLKFKWRKDK